MGSSLIFLYGPPGCGKSSLGQTLAQHLHRDFIDLDERIETFVGRSIPDIFKYQGEAAFRTFENSVLKTVIQGSSHTVIALGGGALLAEENRTAVQAAGKVLCLTASYNTLLPRLSQAERERPLLADDPGEALRTLLTKRSQHYKSFNPLEIDGLDLSQMLERAQRRLGLFHVDGMGVGYDVMISPGLLHQVGEICLEKDVKGPIVVVSDINVAAHYRESLLTSLHRVGYQTSFVELPSGEKHKTIATLEFLWQAFLEAGLERSSTVLALGGGVVSDLAGFAAATYKRGVPWIVCPTSLLAMVDAGLGGKTGVDLPQGKNLIGAFHAPQFVVVDPDCLNTLPADEVRNGMGEVIKHGIIADPALFNLCCQNWQEQLTKIVTAAIAVKINIICQDPLEKGYRAVLNLGHTVGHALETASGFRLKHGEAIAVGLLAEAKIAEQNGVAHSQELSALIVKALIQVGLSTHIPARIDLDQVMQLMQHDKKSAGGVVRFSLPLEIGKAGIGYQVDPSLVRSVLVQLQPEHTP